jgi:hypothetical protein
VILIRGEVSGAIFNRGGSPVLAIIFEVRNFAEKIDFLAVRKFFRTFDLDKSAMRKPQAERCEARLCADSLFDDR